MSTSVEPERPGDSREMERRHVRGSALFTLGRLFALVLTTATQVVIVRYLGVEEYGAFSYALALVSAGSLLLSLGQGKILSRFLSVFDEEQQYGHMLGSLALAILTVGVTSAAGAGLLVLYADELATSAMDNADAVTVLIILVLLAPMEALEEIFFSVFAVFTKSRSIFVRKYLLSPGLRLAVVLLMVATHQNMVFLAVGYVTTQAVGLAVFFGMLVRILHERGLLQYLRPRRIYIPVRAAFALAIPSLSTVLVYLSMNTGSVILLSTYWGAAEIAAYRAVFPAARLNQFFFASFTTLYLPMAARLFARGDKRATHATYWHTAMLLLVVSFPVFAMTTVFAPLTAVALFGERYQGSGTVLALLSLGYYLNVALGFNAHTLAVFGRGGRLIAINATAAAANVVLCLLLVPAHGAVGVGVANCLTLLVQNVLIQWSLTRTIDTSFLELAYIRPYLYVSAAGLLLWALEHALSPSLTLAVPLVVSVSLLLLFLTRTDLRLGDFFPEVRRVRILRPFVL